MAQTDRQQEAWSTTPHTEPLVRDGFRCGRSFFLALPVPPSANTYYRTRVYTPAVQQGQVPLPPRSMTYLGKGGVEFREEVRRSIRDLDGAPFVDSCLTSRLSVDVTLHFEDRRTRDIDNRLKPLLDALQHAGVYEDDSQVDVLRVVRGHVRPGCGRCFVTVVELLPLVNQKELDL